MSSPLYGEATSSPQIHALEMFPLWHCITPESKQKGFCLAQFQKHSLPLQRSISPLQSYLRLRAAARWHLRQEQHLASISGLQEQPYPNTTHSREAKTLLYVGLTNAQLGLPQGKGDLSALECTPAMENGEVVPTEERCTNFKRKKKLHQFFHHELETSGPLAYEF